MSLSTTLLQACAALMSPSGQGARLAILMYHRVLPEPDELTHDMHARDFDAQMRALREYFNVLPLHDAVERLAKGTLPARSVAITFDDGYADNLTVALPILQTHGLHATFFIANGYLNGGRMFNDTVIEAVRRMRQPTLDLSRPGLPVLPVGSLAEKQTAFKQLLKYVKHLPPDERAALVARIAESASTSLPTDLMMTDDQVRKLAAAGMDMGGHTVSHPILTRIDLATARNEIETNRRALATITGQTPTLFAYPNGVPNQDYAFAHATVVREAGYRAAVTTSWGASRLGADLFQLPRFTPWDREPKRFALRLLHNQVRHRPTVLTADGVAA